MFSSTLFFYFQVHKITLAKMFVVSNEADVAGLLGCAHRNSANGFQSFE